MGLLASVLITTLLYTCSHMLMSLFVSDENVIDIGVSIMHYLPLFFEFYIFIEVFSGTLRGTGNSFKPMIIAISGICIPRILWLTVVVPKNQSLFTILFTFPLSWVLTGCMFIVYFVYYTKKRGWWKKDLMKAAEAKKA